MSFDAVENTLYDPDSDRRSRSATGNGRKGPSFVFAISACKPFRLEACKARRRAADACFGTVLNRGVYYCCKKAAAKRRAECQGGIVSMNDERVKTICYHNGV